jgi:hypothetical protein
MRNLVLGALFVVIAGASYAAYLSGTSPGGSAIGDITLPEERSPRTRAPLINGSARRPAQPFIAGVPPARVTGAETALPTPEMVIAGGRLPSGLDAPVARRTPPQVSEGGRFSSSSTRRRTGGSFGGGGFSGGGGFAGGAGGVGGAGGYAPPREGTSVTRNATSFTTLTGKPVRERPTPPSASPRPSPSRPPARSPSSSSPSPTPGEGASAGSSPTPDATASAPVAGAAAAGAAAPGGSVGVVAGPGAVSNIPEEFVDGGAPSPAPTPEPTTMLLMGTGLAGLYRLRRYLQ